ncbi:MAG: diguanylate cyclase [Gemmatimonadales bacterium]|nr:diguanylate cyclase [Gemmatimonadales bacterium]
MPLTPRLLLATEDTALARTLSWVLKENGYDVVTAAGGPQLIERLEQEEYDLFIVDIADADAGTIDRITRIRTDPTYHDMPLLLMSDPEFDTALLDAFRLGAADVVQRPYRVRELLGRIKAHLRVGRELNKSRTAERSRTEMVAILKEVTGMTEPAEIYQVLVRRVANGLRIARCSVVLASPGDTEGTVVAAFENPTLRDLRVELVKYPEIIRALEQGETVMVSDVGVDPLYQTVRSSWGADPGAGRTQSVIAVPFPLRGQIGGVFFLRTTTEDPPLNDVDLGFAEQVIQSSVAALERAYDIERGRTGEPSLRELADTDPLTGCANRRVLDLRLAEELDRARRYDQVVTVVMVDVDDFKRINDTYGHAAGDEVLRQLAVLLRRELRTMDFLARYGGEEFLIVLPETGGTGARLFVDRILRRVQQFQFGEDGVQISVTASAGLATFPDDRAADDQALLKLADQNLYKAKRAGRNRYRD